MEDPVGPAGWPLLTVHLFAVPPLVAGAPTLGQENSADQELISLVSSHRHRSCAADAATTWSTVTPRAGLYLPQLSIGDVDDREVGDDAVLARPAASGGLQRSTTFDAPLRDTCSIITMTHLAPCTRSMAPPMPLTIEPGGSSSSPEHGRR